MSNNQTLPNVIRQSSGNPCAFRGCGDDAENDRRGFLCHEHATRLSQYAASWLALGWRGYIDDTMNARNLEKYDQAMAYAQAELDAVGIEYGGTLPLREREARAYAWRQTQGMIDR